MVAKKSFRNEKGFKKYFDILILILKLGTNHELCEMGSILENLRPFLLFYFHLVI